MMLLFLVKLYAILPINPEFRDTVLLFYMRSNVEVSYPIEFNTETHGWLAYCDFKSTRRIFVNPKKWEETSVAGREQLLLHELGHCSLNREHYSALNAEGKPISLMSETGLIDDEYYMKNKEYYLSELVNNINIRD